LRGISAGLLTRGSEAGRIGGGEANAHATTLRGTLPAMRPPRFRLRTMMVVVAVVAIGLGTVLGVGRMRRRWAEYRAEAAWLQADIAWLNSRITLAEKILASEQRMSPSVPVPDPADWDESEDPDGPIRIKASRVREYDEPVVDRRRGSKWQEVEELLLRHRSGADSDLREEVEALLQRDRSGAEPNLRGYRDPGGMPHTRDMQLMMGVGPRQDSFDPDKPPPEVQARRRLARSAKHLADLRRERAELVRKRQEYLARWW
jgi:hypothetical protein